MKGKVVIIGCTLLIIFAGLLSIGYKEGFSGTSVVNPMKELQSIAELQNSVNFEFKVPNIVIEDITNSNTEYKLNSYMGQMVEIASDKLTFRVAQQLPDGADVSGDYSKYKTDNYYKNIDGTLKARYRSDSNSTLINLDIDDLAYSIKFNTRMSAEEAFTKLEIDISKLEIYEKEGIQQESSEETLEEELGTEKEITFKLFENEDMQVSFMLPSIESNITGVSSGNQLTLMMGNKVIMVIEHYENGYKTEQFNGFTIKEIDENYLIRYIIDNEFEKDTQLYKDYYTIIENMDTVVNTFKIIE